MEEHVCPGCGRDDQLAKVASIVMGETSTGEDSGTGYGVGSVGHGGSVFTVDRTNVTGTTQTALAAKLALPPKPSDQCTLAAILLLPGLGLFGFSGFHIISGGLKAVLYGREDAGSIVGLVIGALLLCAAIGAYAEAVKSGDVKRALWNWAAQIWPLLFYCHRCGGVYLPGRERLHPVEAGISFLADISDE